MALPPEGFDQIIQDGVQHEIYACGSGKPVVLVHELTGVTEATLRLARYLAREGYRVYLPVMFGAFPQPPGPLSALRSIAHVCLSREFRVLSRNETSPITRWLRDVTKKVGELHADQADQKIGLIGMCLSGGFVLYMMLEQAAGAVVVCQPSVPFMLPWPVPFPADAQQAYGLSPSDKRDAQHREPSLPILALRFNRDFICPKERIDQLQVDFPQTVRPCLDRPNGLVVHPTLTEQRSAAAFGHLVTFLGKHI